MKKYIILGKYPVIEAIKNKPKKISKVYTLKQNEEVIKKYKHIEYVVVNKNFFKNVSKNEEYLHQGYAADILSETNDIESLKKTQNNIVILDSINDPRNQGSILRNCLAFNIYNVVIEKKYYTQESIAMHLASSGASMKVKIYEVSNINNIIKELKKNQYLIYGLDGLADKNLSDVDFHLNKNAFIFGSEGHGIRKNIKEKCNELLRIEINSDIDSLNVSNASAITLYELNKKKTAHKKIMGG